MEQQSLRNYLGASPAEVEDALERCEVVFFESSPVQLPEETDLAFLRDRLPSGLKTKNISYHPESDSVPGFDAEPETRRRVQALLKTHGERVEAFLRAQLPHLAPGWTVGTTSFRPLEEKGRDLKPRSSNELVHFDAGAYGATNGNRILRFFANIHPSRERVWGTKGDFPTLLAREPELLRAAHDARGRLRLRKSLLDHCYSGFVRTLAGVYPLAKVVDSSPYDRAMRRIHNYMKETPSFRESRSGYREVRFPPYSAWMVFTDGVSHSVLTGRYALVTTFLVPLANCRRPEFTPYHVLAQAS
jgi:hypothetical protein